MRISRRRRDYLESMEAARGFQSRIRHSARRRLAGTALTFAAFLLPTAAFVTLSLGAEPHLPFALTLLLTVLAGPHLCLMSLLKAAAGVDPTVSMVVSAVLVTALMMRCLVRPRLEPVALLCVGWALTSGVAVAAALYHIANISRLPAAISP